VRRCAAAVVIALVLSGATGCGGSDPENLRVSAAASLRSAFTKYASDSFPSDDIQQSFAGSDQLAAQIEQGATPDVFASANTSYPEALYSKGLLEKPVVFTRNRLVLAVPADSDLHSVRDLVHPGLALVIGDPDVPVGQYTREVLGRLPTEEERAILAHVRSQEPDVSSIVGKLVEGAADAGFVYVTDVRAAGGALKTVTLPASLQPEVAYDIGVVSHAANPDLARRFIRGLLAGGPGAQDLQQAGFLPPG
jgi:molybdate transport system substrate-binding protein